MLLALGWLVGFAGQPVEAAPCHISDRPTKEDRVAADTVNQDLLVLRELDGKRFRGEITDREYRLL